MLLTLRGSPAGAGNNVETPSERTGESARTQVQTGHTGCRGMGFAEGSSDWSQERGGGGAGSACREREGQVQAPEGMGVGVAPSRRVGGRAQGA